MQIVKGSNLLITGAMVPDERELKAMIHALIMERSRITGEGTKDYNTENVRYGDLSLEELDNMINRLQQLQRERGV